MYIIAAVLLGLKSFLAYYAGTWLSKSIHAKMTYKLLHAKFSSYLERIRSGQIINLFSNDMENIDKRIPDIMHFFYLLVFLIILDSFLVIFGANSLLVLIPMLLFALYSFYCRTLFMRAKKHIQRLYNISKTPLSSIARSICTGKSTITCLGQENYFKMKMDSAIQDHTKNYIAFFGLNSWFSVKMILANFFLVMLPTYTYVFYSISSTEVDPFKLVLFVLKSTVLVRNFRATMFEYLNSEAEYTSLERCIDFSKIEVEEGYKFEEREKKQHRKIWKIESKSKMDQIEKLYNKQIEISDICMKGVSSRYSTQETDVIKNIDFEIKAGEKVALVGRTGSGKSSLVKLIWRDLLHHTGSITISGNTPIENLTLKSLRHSISFISQQTSIIEGSLRENIFLDHSPTPEECAEVFQTLKKLGFSEEKLKGGKLDLHIQQFGNNLGQSEKQLI